MAWGLRWATSTVPARPDTNFPLPGDSLLWPDQRCQSLVLRPSIARLGGQKTACPTGARLSQRSNPGAPQSGIVVQHGAMGYIFYPSDGSGFCRVALQIDNVVINVHTCPHSRTSRAG